MLARVALVAFLVSPCAFAGELVPYPSAPDFLVVGVDLGSFRDGCGKACAPDIDMGSMIETPLLTAKESAKARDKAIKAETKRRKAQAKANKKR